ncbi:helix-turn-helix domain-containing protein, partial [Pseudomonas aeruginosa]|uniref:helix-turn-helix domain-containing protein n=1 Tax=Pseudomonas aeruginosa TaxID=287 RepID=UPI0031B6BAE5
ALEEMEKQMIREALSRHNSKKEVADELGIGIATLYRKIKKYELLNTLPLRIRPEFRPDIFYFVFSQSRTVFTII